MSQLKVWDGSAWVPAVLGAQGAQGTQGPQGAQGTQGPQGATGAQGAQGPTGFSGVIAVTSPITNSGSSTSASLGFDATGFVKTSDTGTVTSTMIADGTIVNADINTAAGIGAAKISGTAATLTANQNVFTGSQVLGGSVSSIYIGRLQIKANYDIDAGNDQDFIDFFTSDGTLLGRIDGFGTFQLPFFQGNVISAQVSPADGSGQGIKLSGGNVTVGSNVTAGGGVGVIKINNRTTAPTTNPTLGGVLYVESGALKYRGSSGTITTIAPA